MISTNVDGNDRYEYKDEVYSWSPGQSSSFVAFIILVYYLWFLPDLMGRMKSSDCFQHMPEFWRLVCFPLIQHRVLGPRSIAHSGVVAMAHDVDEH